MKRINGFKTGFTLIELLIVVAIIAILAAIAVPNFLEAQTRAKVSRVRADHRTIATGIEVYRIDHNKYMKCAGNNWCFATTTGGPGGSTNTPTLERLTSPISYLTGKAGFADPFVANSFYEGSTLATKTQLPQNENKGLYWYTARNARDSAVWGQTEAHDVDPYWFFLQSAGPDLAYDWGWKLLNGLQTDTPFNRAKAGMMIYDASNGTVSRGSVWRAGGTPTGWGSAFYHVIANSNS